jgi:hypothetical protein
VGHASRPLLAGEHLSGLGLGPTGPFMNAAFVVCGLLLTAGAIGIAQALWPVDTRARRIVAVLLALPGLGSVIDGFFTFESFMPHLVGFGLALTAIAGFPVAGVLLRRDVRRRRLGKSLIVAGPLTAALTVLTSPPPPRPSRASRPESPA